MKFTAKIVYACKAVGELAANYDSPEPMRVKHISEAQRIPKKFLVQILIRLKNAGIVKSLRGASGGYMLSMRPERISLADIFRALDANILADYESVNNACVGDIDKILQGLLYEVNGYIVQKFEDSRFDKIAANMNKNSIDYCI